MYSNQDLNHHGTMYNAYYRMPNDISLVNNIQKAINAEYSAITCYEHLAKVAPTNDVKEKVLEIQKDEKRHFKEFSNIYRNLTGQQPTYTIIENCPKKYRAGIEFAFKDEQEAVDFYLDIADQTKDSFIKDRFRRAAADEQNHAVWFMFFISNVTDSIKVSRQIENYGAKGALTDTTLTIPQMLTYALQDEYLAQTRYDNILEIYGNIPTFTRIKQAEMRHISELLPLFQRYQVPFPEDLSQNFITTPESIKASYAAGVQGEVDNIAMYDKFLSFELPVDMRTVFQQLRNASLNHLAAFERGLARD
ncbi:ferritin family protein [Aquibacillus saliphilus]|uniref:ferritin family protein n=1 Tax=Aquibacillus saliphilus TaxID=1909422 RepID=UPI001CF023A6|nr:ferritin family protein [Aquibacillus saliphilus]